MNDIQGCDLRPFDVKKIPYFYEKNFLFLDLPSLGFSHNYLLFNYIFKNNSFAYYLHDAFSGVC